MSGYWIFGFGLSLGVLLGLILAGLLGMAHQGEMPDKLEAEKKSRYEPEEDSFE